MPATFLAFSRFFPTASNWPSKRLLRIAFLFALGLSALSCVTDLIAYDITQSPEGIQRSAGPMFPLYAIYLVTCTVAAISAFIIKATKVRGFAKAQLQYLGTGVVIVSAGAITSNLLVPIFTGRSSYSWLGPYFSLPLVLLVGHAIIRYRLMDLRLVINRGITYLVMSAVLSVIAIGLVRAVVYPSRSMLIPYDALVVIFVALLMISIPGQRLVERMVDPYLYRRRLDHPSALRDATHRLSRLMQPAELADEIRTILAKSFVPETFAMIVRTSENQDFELLRGELNMTKPLRQLSSLLTKRNMASAFLVNPAREAGHTRIVHEMLREAGIEVVITLGRRAEPLGAILLGPRKSGDAYFAADLTFIESLAEIASIAVENSLLYRQRIQMLEYSDRLLEALDSAVLAVDVDGRITSFNSAAKSLLSLADSSRNCFLDVLPSDVSWALTLAITAAWRPVEVEASVDHPHRGGLPVVLSTAVLHDESKQVSGALVVVTDLSTIKALEHNQRRIQHLATMARFYAGIAHEIRSPLAAISNFVAMLPDRFDDAEYRDTAARILPMEVGRIVRLADRLRLMAPSEGGKLTEISLPPLLTDIIAIHGPAAEEEGIRITLKCPEDAPMIAGDPGQLVQLFVNLLKNATESMPGGGHINIDLSAETSLMGEERVIVRIMDEGSGIDPSFRGRIFEPFFTTKPSGTGLGLSICREIADFHRARLALIPRPGRKGTTAQIEFPRLDADSVTRSVVALPNTSRE